MDTLFTDFLERMEFLHKEIRTELDRLPEEALDWSPAEDMNSIAVLLTHLVGAEQYWTCDMPAGGQSERVRSAEFEVTESNHEQLNILLDKSMVRMRSVLETHTVVDLEKRFTSVQFDNSTFNGSWCLLHALEHSATHVGHIQMMRHYWQHTHPEL